MGIRTTALAAVALVACSPDTHPTDTAVLISTENQAAAKAPATLSLVPRSRFISFLIGGAARGDSTRVTLTGTADRPVWSASRRKSWTTLLTTSGRGTGTLKWTRNANGLAAGTYIDTITVTATGVSGSPARLIDTMIIRPAAPPPPPPPPPPSGNLATLGVNGSLHGRQIFPSSSLWNQPVDTAQIDPNSSAILSAIGLSTALHPDFGADWNGGPFGISYVVVPDTQHTSPVTFQYSGESDAGPYPIPANAFIEPGDGHLLMITQGTMKLFELFGLQGGPPWTGGSGAIFDLINGTTRPAGWTSADAAGLPIFPGLVRYDEVYETGAINHALRFTVARSRRAYVAPASHWASSSTDPLRAPMGMRVRLKASVNIASYPPAAQVILRALKKYGMIVADNGSNFFLSGTADARWDDGVNNTLKQVKVGDFEVVKMGNIVTN